MSNAKLLLSAAAAACLITATAQAVGPVVYDPGPRFTAPFPGYALSTLTPEQRAYFVASKPFFMEKYSVSGSVAGSPGVGLGPRFNLDSCAGCHNFPTVGGTSPLVNPQIAIATALGAKNTVPSFIASNGPIRVPRFKLRPDGLMDGSVHPLFSIGGRSDAPGCNLPQTDFAAEVAKNNVVVRIPSATYGSGLIEATPDANLIAAVNAMAPRATTFGVKAIFNHDPVDGSIGRFGWKAQHKSLLAFSGEAQMVEHGVTNEERPTENFEGASCAFNMQPEDRQPLTPRGGAASASAFSSKVQNMAAFMRFSAVPPRGQINADVTAGQALFARIGCDTCHIPSQKTAPSPITGNRAVTYMPYSDFALHMMGGQLYDGVRQNDALPTQWRTAPLWGLGQRLFFLHDGRATNLDQAIQFHYALSTVNPAGTSEANKVKQNYDALTDTEKRQLMKFLRSL